MVSFSFAGVREGYKMQPFVTGSHLRKFRKLASYSVEELESRWMLSALPWHFPLAVNLFTPRRSVTPTPTVAAPKKTSASSATPLLNTAAVSTVLAQ
jgi:hypothetical protein